MSNKKLLSLLSFSLTDWRPPLSESGVGGMFVGVVFSQFSFGIFSHLTGGSDFTLGFPCVVSSLVMFI